MKTYYSGFYPLETADGAKGSAAFLGAQNTAIVYLYRRSTVALVQSDKPNGDVTYTFSTGSTVISATNGWTSTIPSGTDPLYIVAATATTTEASYIIKSAQWSTPVVLAQSGTSGLSSATVFLFKRSSSKTVPSLPGVDTSGSTIYDTTYTFSSGQLVGVSSSGNTTSPYLSGWSQTAPDSSTGRYLYYTQATAIGYGTTDTISSTEWAPVKLLTENGISGYTAYLTNESHTLVAASDGEVTDYTGATGEFKVYLDGVGDISSNFSLTTLSSNPQTLAIGYNGIVYTVGGGFDKTKNTASITIRGTGKVGTAYAGITIDKVFTLSKSKAGINGSPAKTIQLSADRQLISYNSDGAASPSSQTITFTHNAQNTTGTVVYSMRDTSTTADKTSYLTTVSGVKTLTASNFQTAISGSGAQGVIVTATVDGLSDSITIMKVQAATPGSPGEDAIIATISNDSMSVVAFADGTVPSSSFTNAKGVFKLLKGSTDITSSATLSATSSGCTGTIDASGNYQVTAMSADTATLTLTATYPVGSTKQYSKIFSLAKAIKAYEIVSAFPTTNLFNGRLVYLTANILDASGNIVYYGKQQYKYTTATDGWVAVTAADQVLGKLTAAQIASLSTAQLTGTIGTDLLAANAIVASKILAVDTNSLITDPNFADTGTSDVDNYWNLGDFTLITNPANSTLIGLAGIRCITSPTGNGTKIQTTSPAYIAASRISIEPGKPYRLYAKARVGLGFTGRIGVRISWYKYSTTGTLVSVADPYNTGYNYTTVRALNTAKAEIGDFTSVANTAAKNIPIEGIVTTPATAQLASVSLIVEWSTSINNASYCAYSIPRMMRAMNSELVVDGTITSDKLESTEVSAMFATIGVMNSSSAGDVGARVVISDDVIKVYDDSSVSATTGLRVKLGNLA